MSEPTDFGDEVERDETLNSPSNGPYEHHAYQDEAPHDYLNLWRRPRLSRSRSFLIPDAKVPT